MNERGAASVQSIIRNVLSEPPDGLLYFAIFCSQVRGDERSDSDLDTLFVVREAKQTCIVQVSKAATGVVGGVENVTIIPHIPETIQEMANLYGSVEYHVLREHDAKTLYRSADYTVQLQTKIDYEYSAKRWLENAKAHIFLKDADSESPPLRFRKGIDCLLRASLLSIKVKFPYTRDIRVLYNLLPVGRRPPLDIDVIATIPDKYFDNQNDWSQDEACMVAVMAKQAYKSTEKMINSKNV